MSRVVLDVYMDDRKGYMTDNKVLYSMLAFLIGQCIVNSFFLTFALVRYIGL